MPSKSQGNPVMRGYGPVQLPPRETVRARALFALEASAATSNPAREKAQRYKQGEFLRRLRAGPLPPYCFMVLYTQ